jgi:hypothetical protein
MGLHFVNTIRVVRRRDRLHGIDYHVAYAGLGVHEWQAHGVTSDEAVSFLVDGILKNDPNMILASSVEIVHIASNLGDHAQAP